METSRSRLDHHRKAPADFLNTLYLERKAKNPRYSTRALARDLGMSQALLSLVLNKKRPLSVKQATKISALLGFSAREADEFVETALASYPKMKRFRSRARRNFSRRFLVDVELERFQMIAQWFHIALLDLTTTWDFKNDPQWIAKRLGITAAEARDALERLIHLGFLERKGDSVQKTEMKIFFDTDRSESAVRCFHEQMLRKAIEELRSSSDAAFQAREISGITLAVRKDLVALAKKKIRKFQEEMAELLTEGESNEVYQLNVQLFPLTRKQTRSKESKS